MKFAGLHGKLARILRQMPRRRGAASAAGAAR
jgi:hypothetical protein